MAKRFALIATLLALVTVIAFGISWMAVPDDAGPLRWKLPAILGEASGLAVVDEATLLSHNDEQGYIFRLLLDQQRVAAAGAIGDPVVLDDFEGIALDGADLYLVTSAGDIYHVENYQPLTAGVYTARVLQTALGDACEIEGLAWNAGELLLPCKVPRQDAYRNRLVVFAVQPQGSGTSVRLSVPLSVFSVDKTLKPSAIEVIDDTWYVIASRHLIVIDTEASAFSVYELRKKHHPQPEGIAVLADGSIIIVEDDRSGSAVTRYRQLEELQLVSRGRLP